MPVVAAKRVSLTNSAGGTLIVPANSRRDTLIIKNVGSNAVWIGADTTVTAGTAAATDGFKLATNEVLALYANQSEAVKEAHQGIASTGATDVTVYEHVG